MRILLTLLLILLPGLALAQNHRAVIVQYPSTKMNAGHRVFRAHPDIPFSYTTGAIGGTNIFTTYSLNGAPAWMNIRNAGAGETCSRAQARAATAAGMTLTWVNCGEVYGTPTNTTTDDDASYTITACDSTAACDTSDTLSIDVTTTGFKFVATTGNNGNAGTLASPFLNFLALEDPAKVDATDIIYFRTGTYLVQCAGVANQGSAEEKRCEYNDGDGVPTQFIAYPGETVTINYGYDGTGEDATNRITLIAPHIWVEGFIFDNAETMGVQLGNEDSGATIRNNTFLDLLRGLDGTNSGHLMTIGGTTPTVQSEAMIEGNDFGTIVGDPTDPAGAHIKGYSLLDAIFQNNLYHDSPYEALALKESISGFTVRFETFYDNTGDALGGNMGCTALTECTFGEAAYNHILSASGNTLFINQNNEAGPIYFYRNTLRGVIFVDATASPEGPFNFTQNVVINGQGANPLPYITAGGTIYGGGVVQTNELAAASGLIDSFGLLTGADRTTYLGTRGFEIDTPAAVTPPVSNARRPSRFPGGN